MAFSLSAKLNLLTYQAYQTILLQIDIKLPSVTQTFFRHSLVKMSFSQDKFFLPQGKN